MSFVVSCLRSLVLLIALLDNVVYSNFSFRPTNSTCVWTERQLRKVIAQASNETRTSITLCRQNISISSTRDQYNRTGIDVTDRTIDLGCNLKRSKGLCILDGGQSSRIFRGNFADLSVRNVLFTNALPDDCSGGGAILIGSSNVTLTGCSFMNNGNNCREGGGAILVEYGMLKINGGSKKRPVMFSDNESTDGAALSVFQSKVSIDGYTVFSNNSAGRFSGAVDLYHSTFDIKNVIFQENFAESSGSAIFSFGSQSTMRNIEFIGNDGGGSVIFYSESSLFATNCSFANNNGTVIGAMDSKIILKNSIFSNNTSNKDASNIYIVDDNIPFIDGTFVKCESNVVFCNGLDNTSIKETSFDNTNGKFNNTDCNSKGVRGSPGQGSCPM